jgi:hypothetical protein
MSALAPHLPTGGRGILTATMFSGLSRFLTRRDLNATIAALPTLFWTDPHPGRIIHSCKRRDMARLQTLMDSVHAPYGWPAVEYSDYHGPAALRKVANRYGTIKHASTLFEAAVNAYWREGALLAVAIQPWTPKTAARAIVDHLTHTSWTDVADALLAKAGPEVLARLQHGPTMVCCMGSREPMLRWFVTHGLDINVRSDLDGQTVLHGAVHFVQKDRVALLLSLGAQVDSHMLADCFYRYAWYREEDPEGSGDWDAMEILRMLIPRATPAVLNTVYRGYTPLHRLVRDIYGREDLAALMLAHGADVNRRDQGGQTALFWAENDGGAPYVPTLRAAGGK